MSDFIKWTCSLLCAFAGFLFGGLDGLLKALLVFMILDCITGIALSIAKGKGLSSRIGYAGFLKKGLILIIVVVANILDTWVLGIGSSACRNTVIGFYIANEGISILENVGRAGMPLPKVLRKILEQLRDENKEDKS